MLIATSSLCTSSLSLYLSIYVSILLFIFWFSSYLFRLSPSLTLYLSDCMMELNLVSLFLLLLLLLFIIYIVSYWHTQKLFFFRGDDKLCCKIEIFERDRKKIKNKIVEEMTMMWVAKSNDKLKSLFCVFFIIVSIFIFCFLLLLSP